MPTKFCTTVTVLPPRPAFTRMMSTRPLDLRGGSFRFVSFELPGGRPALFKSANGLLKSLTLDLCPLAIHPIQIRRCSRVRSLHHLINRRKLYTRHQDSTTGLKWNSALAPLHEHHFAIDFSFLNGMVKVWRGCVKFVV